MSPIQTIGPLGYRRLGDLPRGTNDNRGLMLAQGLASVYGYERYLESSYVRLPFRRVDLPVPETIRLVSVISADSTPTEADLAFMPHAIYLTHREAGVKKPVYAEQDVLTRLVDDAPNSPNRWLALHQIGRAVITSQPLYFTQLLVRHALPALFRMYPGGKLTVWKYNHDSPGAFGGLPMLYSAALMPLKDELGGQQFVGFATQQEAMGHNVFDRAPVLFDFLSYLFFPFVGGFQFSAGPFLFMFLFDKPEEICPPPFPSDWLAHPKRMADFAREQVDHFDPALELPSPARSRAALQRLVHLTGFGVEDRLTLLKWLVKRFNRLTIELNDVCNFLVDPNDPDSEVEPIFAFEHLLTVDRLSRSTLLAMTYTEPTAARTFAFEVADLYGELNKRHRNVAAPVFSKQLLNPADAPGILKPLLATLPEPFASYFVAQTDESYRRLEEGVIESVWVRNRVTSAGVRVKTKDLQNDETLTRGSFVAELLRATRNSHHGYLSDLSNKNLPARFLLLADGNIPVELSSLPALWWLAFCADPALVGWKHLPTNHYPE
ncbi:MAG TPA: hypothetical protein VHR66_16280 [Gemmataceae bacterium]|nr:hypothetical protein [Gemmataceae bacterium]